MPRKKLGDENANARRTRKADPDKMQLKAVASGSGPNDDEIKRKVLLCGDKIGDAIQGRFFAREIKNIVGRTQTGGTLASEAYSRMAESETFTQLTANFESLNLRNDLASQASAIPSKSLPVNTDTSFQPCTLFTREAFALSSSGACSACKGEGKLVPQTGYESDGGNRFHSRTFSSSCWCKRASACKRYSISTSTVTKRSSFRSASIVSQSTPLLGKIARRSIRPFKPLEDESDMYPRFSASREVGKTLTTEIATETCAESRTLDAGDTSGALMTQLASQLSEVVLSPCIYPLVPDSYSESPGEDSASLSQGTGLPVARSKDRVDSFSLGFIPTAFPEEIDIRNLRVVL